MTRNAVVLATLALGGCFDGAHAAEHLPCSSDRACGGLACEQGFCGGPPVVESERFATKSPPSAIAIDDVDGDGVAELVLGTRVGAVHVCRLDGPFACADALATGFAADDAVTGIAAAEMVPFAGHEILATSASGAFALLSADGTPINQRASDGAFDPIVGDFDGTSSIDFAFGDPIGVRASFNHGDGTFEPMDATGGPFNEVVWAEFPGLGPALAALDASGPRLRVRASGASFASFGPEVVLELPSTGDVVRFVALDTGERAVLFTVDVHGDARIATIAGDRLRDSTTLGRFGDAPSRLRTVDVDCDGALDVVAAARRAGASDVVLARSDGLGGFERPVALGMTDAVDVIGGDCSGAVLIVAYASGAIGIVERG